MLVFTSPQQARITVSWYIVGQHFTYLGDVRDPLTLNRYAYGKNSPENYVDPSGHVAVGASGSNSRNVQVKGQNAHYGKQHYSESNPEYKGPDLQQAMIEALDYGNYKGCVRAAVRRVLNIHGIDPDSIVSWFDHWMYPDPPRRDFVEKANEYVKYIFGASSYADTEEVFLIRTTVFDILVDTIKKVTQSMI